MNYALQEGKRTMHLSARFWGSKRTFLWRAKRMISVTAELIGSQIFIHDMPHLPMFV